MRKGLETVHHGTIVSVGGGRQDSEHEDNVESPHAGFLVPCHSGEALPRELKGRLGRSVERHLDGVVLVLADVIVVIVDGGWLGRTRMEGGALTSDVNEGNFEGKLEQCNFVLRR